MEPCGLALVGVPLMALKMPIESDRVLLEPSSTGFIYSRRWIYFTLFISENVVVLFF